MGEVGERRGKGRRERAERKGEGEKRGGEKRAIRTAQEVKKVPEAVQKKEASRDPGALREPHGE